MRPLFTTIFLIYFLPGFSQDSTAKIFVKEVRWNIAIPENFDLVADSVQNKFNKSGAKLLGETNNVTVDVSQTKTLLVPTMRIIIFMQRLRHFPKKWTVVTQSQILQ